MKWIEVADKKWGLVVVPLHGRGNKNGEGAPVKVLIYYPPADPRAKWETEVVVESMHMMHNFYIEHWSLGVFWRKMRELNRLFITAGFWSDPEGLFFLSRNEVRDALWDYCSAWAVGGAPTGPHFWPQRIAQRR